jgi:transposase, IS5 family
MAGQPGFFDVEERLARLSAKGDELERLSGVVDFELFRPELERAVPRSDRLKGGRPPFDHVVMFKVLILQTQNNLSDERTEFYLRDRLSWMRFLGLGLGDPVPDANTIWTFREALTIGLRPIPRRDVSEADRGRRDRALVRALRPGAADRRLSGDVRPIG